MNRKLTAKDYIFMSSMIFGLFFGAGNLIFPVHMGQQAGANTWPAVIGFCLTGVGLPLLGIVALARSQTEDVFQMGKLVGKKYSYFFTCALYLTIGPLFAIPRTATVSFNVGIAPLAPDSSESTLLLIFSALFFLAVLYFSLRPSGILTWVGKILNPLFLLFLGILAVTALVNPIGQMSSSAPVGAYQSGSLFQGIIDGYNTLDAPAALAFGIVMIEAMRGLGVTYPKKIASGIIKSGTLSCILMAAIYCVLAVMGAQSGTRYGISADGGAALYLIGSHYFGSFGGVVLGITVTLACLKTAVGLITSCSKAFKELFPNSFGYNTYVIIFCLSSFGIANFGLNKIIEFSLPVLMFLYPLTITLIFLCLSGGIFKYDKRVFISVTVCTIPIAVLDFFNALPAGVVNFLGLSSPIKAALEVLPFSSLGMGWVIPSLIGLAAGLIIHFSSPGKSVKGA